MRTYTKSITRHHLQVHTFARRPRTPLATTRPTTHLSVLQRHFAVSAADIQEKIDDLGVC